MELNKLLSGVEDCKAKGDLSIDISKVTSNSKEAVANSLFVAIKGFDFDGHDYIEEAVKNGAVAVMVDMNADLRKVTMPKGVVAIICNDTRKALAKLACNFYGNPSSKFKLIGITGTKGKTTTTYMIKSILEKAGHKVGLIGTIARYSGDEFLGFSSRTTPDSVELQELFYRMVKDKCDYVVMEVSSQSLKLHRVDGCQFDYGIFTNLYKDHISLKEHSDMNDYFESKLKLFSMCKYGFVNADDFKCNKVISGAPNCSFKTYLIL